MEVFDREVMEGTKRYKVVGNASCRNPVPGPTCALVDEFLYSLNARFAPELALGKPHDQLAARVAVRVVYPDEIDEHRRVEQNSAETHGRSAA